MDLSKIEARVPRQDRKVDRRSGIVPEVDPRQSQRQVFADMRSARRGNGGAEYLLKSLGMFSDAASNAASTYGALDAQKQDELGKRGSLDAATGQVDEKLLKKSRGYRDAVSLGRASTEWTKHKAAKDQEFAQFIEGQDDLDLETRQAQALAWIEKNYFHDFALDPDTGGVKDFGSPGAARALAETIGKTRADLINTANARIEERFNGEALTHFSDFVRTSATEGHFDLNDAIKLLPKGIPQEVVTKTYLDTAMAVSEELMRAGRVEDATRVIDQALGYGEAVGSIDQLPTEAPAPGQPDPYYSPQPQTVQQKIGRIAIAADKLAALVLHQESRGDPNAVSSEGAIGTMQTMPGTLTDPGYGVRPARDRSPAELERVGKDYLKALGRHYNGSIPLQLAAYNAGPGVVDDWLAGTNKTGKNASHLKLPDPRQKGVSEADFWARIPFKETKNYIRDITARGQQPIATGGVGVDIAVDQGNPDFVTPGRPEDLKDRLNKAGIRILPELKGRFAMTAAQRTQLLQFRESQLTTGRRIEAEDRQRKLDETEDTFAMRMMGQGPTLTPQDILEQVEAGTMTGQDGAKWLKSLESRAEAEVAAADAAANRADREEDRARQQQASNILNGYAADVLSGKMTPAQARQKMMTDLPRIQDPLVRSTVLSSGASFLNGIEGVRVDTPQARQFIADADGLEQGMVSSLSGRVLTYKGRRLTPDQATGIIKQKVDELRVRGANSIKDNGTAPDGKTMKTELQTWLEQTFPRKKVVATK